ncbi:hypothetical protein RA210_U20372 [Rubrivivax sp. A210]|nr:hypothetical protein RA210_U20372 [Rubrivivax sp. A210]
MRRLRRHHLQPPLQEGLGSGRVHRPHGLVEGPFRRAHLRRLRAQPGHLSHGLAGAHGLGPPGRGVRAESRQSGGAHGQGLLLDQDPAPHHADAAGSVAPRHHRPHRRPRAARGGRRAALHPHRRALGRPRGAAPHTLSPAPPQGNPAGASAAQAPRWRPAHTAPGVQDEAFDVCRPGPVCRCAGLCPALPGQEPDVLAGIPAGR